MIVECIGIYNIGESLFNVLRKDLGSVDGARCPTTSDLILKQMGMNGGHLYTGEVM